MHHLCQHTVCDMEWEQVDYLKSDYKHRTMVNWALCIGLFKSDLIYKIRMRRLTKWMN